jgi:hypothetical protein
MKRLKHVVYSKEAQTQHDTSNIVHMHYPDSSHQRWTQILFMFCLLFTATFFRNAVLSFWGTVSHTEAMGGGSEPPDLLPPNLDSSKRIII